MRYSMLYAGFSEFYYEDKTNEHRCGSFIYFAEAKDPDDAIDVFKKGIKKTAKKRSIHIQPHGGIILNSFVELKKLSPEGAKAFFEDRMDDPDFHATIGCTLPGHSPGLDAFD